jgi:beta-lactamase class A
MASTMLRRTFLLGLSGIALSRVLPVQAQTSSSDASHAENHNDAPSPPIGADVHEALAALERNSGGRLGVSAINTGNGIQLHYHADQAFPFCSTFKVILCGAVLSRPGTLEEVLSQRIQFTQSDVVNYSPVSAQHVADGMTVGELCQAALQFSDNTAANVLISLVGGPAAVTSFARSIGDSTFRLDRVETSLNDAIPGDPRDTTSPAAMAQSLNTLALGNALPADARAQLRTWMVGNTTGDKRIRASAPSGWQVGDKTGTGDYGTANDVAVLWPGAGAAPYVIAIYHTQAQAAATPRDDVIASAAQIVLTAMKG